MLKYVNSKAEICENQEQNTDVGSLSLFLPLYAWKMITFVSF